MPTPIITQMLAEWGDLKKQHQKSKQSLKKTTDFIRQQRKDHPAYYAICDFADFFSFASGADEVNVTVSNKYLKS